MSKNHLFENKIIKINNLFKISFLWLFFSYLLVPIVWAAPSITLDNSSADKISMKASGVTITGKVSEPDSGRVLTISANIGGVWKSTTINSPVTNQAWSLSWNHGEMSGGIYTNINFTVSNGSQNASALYTGNITVDKTDPVCNTGTWIPSPVPWKLSPATQSFTLSGVQDSSLYSSGMNVDGGSCLASDTHGSTCTVTVSDMAGNTINCVSPANRIDGGNPLPNCTIASLSNPKYQYITGDTIYFNNKYTGSFTITASISPPVSGIEKVTFPALGSGWTPSGAVEDTISPYQQTYAWSSSAQSNSNKNVTALYGNGLSNSCSFTTTADNTAPTGGSIVYTTQYKTSTSAPLSMTINEGTEAGSGINTSSRKLQRRVGDLVNNACNNYSAYADTTYGGTFPTITDTGTINDKKCYQYRWVVADNVGNEATYTSNNEFKIDTTAPLTTLNTIDVAGSNIYFKAGTNTVYYKTATSSQSLTVKANASDYESGIAQVSFPDINTPGFSSSDANIVTSAPYQRQYSIATNANTSPGTQTVTGTNHAGLTTNFNYAITYDNTNPTSGSVNCASEYSATGTYNITGQPGIDADAGVNNNASFFQIRFASLENDTCATFSSYTNTGSPGAINLAQTTMADAHCYEYRYYTKDLVGNESTSSSCTMKVDTTPPECGDWIPADPVAPKATRSAQLFTLTDSIDEGSGMAESSYQCTAEAVDGATCEVTIYDKAGNSAICTSPTNNIDIPPPLIPTLSKQVLGHNLVWNYIELSPDWTEYKIYGMYPKTHVPIKYELILTIPTIDKSYTVNLTTSTTKDTHFEFVIPIADFQADKENHTFVGPQKLRITDIDNDKIIIIDYNVTFYFPIYHIDHIANLGYYILASDNKLNRLP